MMWTYILKLIVLLPLVCGLMIGCLYLWRKLETRMPGRTATRMIAVSALIMFASQILSSVPRVDIKFWAASALFIGIMPTVVVTA